MTVDSSGLLTWTANDLGTYDVVLEATDTEGNTVVQSWQVEVGTQGVNRSPVIVSTTDPSFENQPPEIVSSPRVSTRSDKVYFYQIDAVDPDGDSLSFELLDAPEGMEVSDGGILSWSPTAADFGFHDVDIAVKDGLWQTVQSWSLFVSDRTTNRPPSITSVPNTVTNTERIYQYQLEGFDADGDLLLWSLDSAPAGMVVNAETGLLSWQPTVEQIGEHSVAVRVIDSSGAFVGQQFDLRVRGINTPPEIVSVPVTSTVPSSEYSYRVVATDPENDPLEFGLGVRPEGMSIDAETGLISWMPETLGSFEVEVLVTDAQGATNRQSYTVEVGEGNANGAPAIVSSPVFVADVGSAYSYDVDATDPDGDGLSYQLIAGPDGMLMDAESGVLSWSSPVLGTHNVVVGAYDGSVGAAQGFVLTAILNAAPTFDDSSVPPAVAVPDKLYSYDVLATDPNGEALRYGLDDDSVALGMTLDDAGRLRWTPTEADAGIHGVTVTVTDGTGASAEQSFDVTVTADTVAPTVELRPLSGYYRSGDDFSAEVATNVTFVVSATDNVAVTGLRLDVDGVTVAVDGNGFASIPFESAGSAVVSAVAVDAAGNEGAAGFDMRVVDFSDTLPPTAILDDSISSEPITSFADVLGTVTDDGDVEYVLEVAPVAGGEFVEIASGSGAVENGKLGEFDPSVLQNDSYVLRLTATDSGGNSSSDEVVVDVTGDLKLGNFRLSFTDLEIPLSGIPISVTRTYDSLNATERDDFGYGWRLEFRDTDLRTSVRRRTPEEELLGVQSPFGDGERVYVTLPGGERTVFTFKPKSDRLNAYFSHPEARWYHPEFVADDGSDLTLRVINPQNTYLIRKAGSNEYVDAAGTPYNPADPRFGGVYELVTKEGVVYTIDAVSGDLLTVVDRNENKLTFSDAGIVSSTGVAVSFERDAAGRIVGVIDPEGDRIGYDYDEFGDLVGVTDREDNTTEFVYDLDERPHFLEEIIDPLGRSGVKTEYDEKGRLQKILDVNGEAVELVYDPDNSTQTVRDVFDNPTTYVYDDRGNVVTEVDAVGKVVERTYDRDNNVKTETVITDESGPEGWTTSFTYDSSGNKLTETNPLGNTTRWTYNGFSQVLTETDPLGNMTSFVYSTSGNLLSVKDAEGNVTNFTYDLRGNPLSLGNGLDRTISFEYDASGNHKRITDIDSEANFTYDSSGNIRTETLKLTAPDGEQQEFQTEWTYNKAGQIHSITDSEGEITEYQYDASGNLAAVIAPNNSTTKYRYDKKNQLVETIYPDDTPDSDLDNPRTIALYDKGDRVRAKIDRSGQIVHYNYDALGRRVEIIHPDGSPDGVERLIEAIAPQYTPESIDWTQVVYPDKTPDYLSDSPRSITEYYETGHIQSETDPSGNTVEYEYDPAGRQTAVRLDQDNYIAYTYDGAGNRLTETIALEGTESVATYDRFGRITASTDPEGKTTRFEYDSFGRLAAVTNALEGRTEYGYDSDGNLTSVKDALRRVTTYTYDDRGRRTAVERPDGKQSFVAYNDVENSIAITDFNGDTVEYDYNEIGQLESKTFGDVTVSNRYEVDSDAGTVEQFIDGERGTTIYTYDLFGRLVGRTDPTGPYLPSGSTIEYEYDGGLVGAVQTPGGKTEYAYDEFGRLQGATHPDLGTTEYAYDSAGNLYQTKFPNGVVETRNYDESNRLVSLKAALTDAATGEELEVISSYEYKLDSAGNRVEVLEGSGRLVKYEYDDLNRLVKEAIFNGENGDRAITYAYDAAGNRLKKVDSAAGETTYTYDELDRLVRSSGSDGTVTYAYDDNGNLIEKVAGDRSTAYEWVNDGENRLVGVEVADAGGESQIQYRYDPNGIRVAEIVGGVETRFLIDDLRPYAQVLEEYDASGNQQAAYAYGYDLIGREGGGQKHFYHADGLGSTRVLADESGVRSGLYNYDAFGNLVGQVGGEDNSYLFAGERRDAETGLDYLRARYYDPMLGRFISADACEGSIGDPTSLHDYLYAHANPVVNTDPSGYVTLNEQLSAFATHTVLASMSYVGGFGIGTWISGGDPLAIYDQYLAGFAHGASGGLSTQFRAQQYGEDATRNHSGPFFNLGQATGSVAVMGLGWGAPSSLANVTWGARVAQVHSMLSSGVGAYRSTNKILAGQSTVWDWLVFLPLISYFGSVAWNQLGSAMQNSANTASTMISSVETLDLEEAAKEYHSLWDMYDSTGWAGSGKTTAVGRIRKLDGTVEIVVSSSGGGRLTAQRWLFNDFGHRYVPSGVTYSGGHAEGRLIIWALQNLTNGERIEAIGVSHPGGICPYCYTDMIRRGIYPESPLHRNWDLSNVPERPPWDWIGIPSWGWIGEMPLPIPDSR
jgi:RHS repeat-associated protein